MILHGCGESQFETGNTQVHSALSSVLHSTSIEIHQNGDRCLGKGMIEVQSQQGVLLAIVSLACLGCVYALCLWCRKKSTVRQEDNDLYDQDNFTDDNVSHSKEYKAVIRPNQSEMPSTSRHSTANRPADSDIQWSYQNFRDENGFLEPTYVDPIPNSVYANDDDAGMDNSNTGTYGNVFPTEDVQHDSDSCSYENLKNESEEESESEYVNAPKGKFSA